MFVVRFVAHLPVSAPVVRKMIQTPCGKSITSVTIWNAAYASQHWKLSINSHQNTPPAFTLQKVSRGMICQLHTGETIR